MKHFILPLAFVLAFVLFQPTTQGALTLKARGIPASGLVMARIPESCVTQSLGSSNLQVRLGETLIPAQYVGGETLVFQCDENQIAQSRERVLEFTLEPATSSEAQQETGTPKDLVQVETSEFRITHEAAKRGGFPNRIEFLKTGHVLDSLAFHDRLYADKTAWGVNLDPKPELEVVSDGPICTVVRTRGVYVNSGKPSDSGSKAVYEWFYFKRIPGLVYVTARAEQERPLEWKEAHFLEIHPNDPEFKQWFGLNYKKGTDLETGTFNGADDQHVFEGWGAVSDGKNFLALSGIPGIYDGWGHYGPYLHAHLHQAWNPWDSESKSWSVWLAVRAFDSPADLVAFGEKFFAKPFPTFVKVEIPADALVLADLKEPWRKAVAQSLLLTGTTLPASFKNAGTELQEPLSVERLTNELVLIKSRDLAALLETKPNSLRLLALADQNSGTCFTPGDAEPIFRLNFRRILKPEETGEASDSTAKKYENLSVSSATLWKSVELEPTRTGAEIRFRSPKLRALGDAELPLEVTLQIQADPRKDGLCLNWSGKSGSEEYSLMEFVPGLLTCGAFGSRVTAFYPGTSGHLVRNAPQSALDYRGGYPSGWAVMPWLAAWDEETWAGIYAGIHDPNGSNKVLRLVANPAKSTFQFTFEYPLPNQTVPGNSFEMPGEVVLQSFHGDWVDAATIYRDWVRQNAKWFPTLTENGRPDSPRCVKELNLWAQDGGSPAGMIDRALKFQAAFGVPAGLHWYCWHKTPFDDDYPHYVAQDGFREAVEKIQNGNQIFVMPYINGRLWDVHDRGVEDFQFTSVALPAVTKKESGEPFIESYGSKEPDGSPVRLGVMCPSTELWRNKMHATVAGLMNDQSVKGVYMDQISAAGPVLCVDPTHGHALGGGSWWRESYEKLLTEIRADVQQNGTDASPASERFITSECNAEVYANRLDGFLTWHVQADDGVPALAFVYGGAIQCFGRNYGGATSDQAFRMKAAQQLVYGEQIGWFDLGTINRPEAMNYLRPLARFRKQINPYFWRGEMARPARFLTELPKITDDWKWQGTTPVTLAAVQTGTWRIVHYPTDSQTQKRDWNGGKTEKAVVIFTNFSTEPVKARVSVNVQELGFPPDAKLTLEKIDAEGHRTPLPADFFDSEITFPALETWGVEIR